MKKMYRLQDSSGIIITETPNMPYDGTVLIGDNLFYFNLVSSRASANIATRIYNPEIRDNYERKYIFFGEKVKKGRVLQHAFDIYINITDETLFPDGVKKVIKTYYNDWIDDEQRYRPFFSKIID